MTNHEVIRNLRENGYRVYIKHIRNISHVWKKTSETTMVREDRITPKGGKTIVELSKGDTVVSTGEAICQKYVFFNKKMAVEVALGRALKGLKVAK